MQLARPHRLRRAATYAVIAALVGVLSLTLSQCTMVGDSQTGVGLTTFKVASCIKKCDKKYADAVKKEDKRHANAIKKCKSNATCLAAEDALHNQKLAAIDANYNSCLNICHRQGGN
jgi:hypothetical protein